MVVWRVGLPAFDGLVTFYHDSAGSESAKWTSFVRNEDQIDRGFGGLDGFSRIKSG
jgi:hypothetical protein